MDKIILIGGSPCARKSSVARAVSRDLGVPWISTDTVREQMKEIVRREDFPYLFSVSDIVLNKPSSEIVEYQNSESADVWKGVKALIETDYTWGDFIIEGVAVLPYLVNELSLKDKKIKAVFLIDSNKKRVRETIFRRGLWDDAEKYSDKLKEKEVDWVMEFNNYIVKEAEKFDFLVVDIEEGEYIKRARKAVE